MSDSREEKIKIRHSIFKITVKISCPARKTIVKHVLKKIVGIKGITNLFLN